jgi:hypothetical protein
LKLSPPLLAVILGPAAFQKSSLCPFKPKKWRNSLGLMFYNRVITHTYNNYDTIISLCKYQCWTGNIFCAYQIGIDIIYILLPTLLIGSATSISCHMDLQIQSSTSRMKTYSYQNAFSKINHVTRIGYQILQTGSKVISPGNICTHSTTPKRTSA